MSCIGLFYCSACCGCSNFFAEEVPLTGATEIVERPVIVTADITTPTGMLRAFII